MDNKKDEFLFVIKLCVGFFALSMFGSFIYCLAREVEGISLVAVEQILVMTGFIFLGAFWGNTDIVLKLKSKYIRAIIVSIILYIGVLILMSQVKFNPFASISNFIAVTFLFICAAGLVTSI